tara:strand:- start:791 stop:1003 length:213 start_codon:yes stop_codon:yes gene_type:complete
MHPSEKRRQGYLAYFKDGVYDALIHGQMDDIRKSSAYYKQGYDFGLSLNFKEIYVGDEEENQTYYLQTRT